MFWLISPISSNRMVPPSASSKRPRRRDTAPVNAPRSWPNSSLSNSVSVSAAQCTRTNFDPRRGDREWIALATSSLPTPLSPVINTEARLGATCSTISNAFFMGGLAVTSLWLELRRSSSRCSSRFSSTN